MAKTDIKGGDVSLLRVQATRFSYANKGKSKGTTVTVACVCSELS